MPSEDLHKPLEAIHKTIARLREDVQALTGEVKKIPAAIGEAAETIRDAIQENIRAQAELKLMDHVMEVKTVKPQIAAERDQIETERNELEERLRSIGERYQDRHEELDETARERIRDLGAHIFALHEEEFEAGVEEPFLDQVTATWHSLQAHNEGVREERNARVTETTGDVVQSIHDFVDRQASLVERIRAHRLDADELDLPTDRSEPLHVPYYVVEYEADGVAQREVVVPSRLSTADGTDWCSVSLSPVPGAADLLSGVSGVDGASRTDTLSERDLGVALAAHGESSPLGLSYADAVAAAVPEDGPIPVRTVEGRD